MLDLEKEYYSDEINIIAGCDEAGRGCLCGPVIAAAVIFPKNYHNELINDSKKLTPKIREKLYEIILKDALEVGVGIVEAQEIDRINIYAASRKAMLMALSQLNNKVDLVLTDAMPLKFNDSKVEPIIKGDAKSLSIAAASIIAKVTRDTILDKYSFIYPKYEFDKHKGYCTKKHLEVIEKYGIIKGFYRESYAPVRKILYENIKLF